MTTITQKHNEDCKEFSDKFEEREKRIKELETLEDKYKELTETHITLKDELNDTRESLKEEKLNVEKTQLLAATLQEAVETEKLARDYAQKLNQKRTQKQLMEKEELGRSATLIQQKWRQYHLKKRQLSFEKEQNELIQYLQSVLRGHTVRDQFLTHRERNTETNELTKTVQNILSGHYVRRMLLQQNER
ncbi:PREDICTED: uncharacterized protein LOC109580457 [Amphimedon queenslandica]|uniref:Uncharacterized protein n=1 Tax=Amphimedon queenslandica TaxID=400682 RepID=A0AAN0IWP1_AMPQE|nr:PREDICTED: uncharacterized protein LOC109580457 [Amphimedon queenslandica]|eukprot:XP_019849200.1 PREDICTED: uncharacterized protein LOC109580457 [Amphimedon queenslandica]